MRKKKKSHLTDFVSLWLFAAIQSEVKITEQHRENGLVVDIKKVVFCVDTCLTREK